MKKFLLILTVLFAASTVCIFEQSAKAGTSMEENIICCEQDPNEPEEVAE